MDRPRLERRLHHRRVDPALPHLAQCLIRHLPEPFRIFRTAVCHFENKKRLFRLHHHRCTRIAMDARRPQLFPENRSIHIHHSRNDAVLDQFFPRNAAEIHRIRYHRRILRCVSPVGRAWDDCLTEEGFCPILQTIWLGDVKRTHPCILYFLFFLSSTA